MMAMTQNPSSSVFQGRKKNPPPFLLGLTNPPGTHEMLHSIFKAKEAFALLLTFLQLMALPTPVQEFQCLLSPTRAPFNALIPRTEPGWRRPPSRRIAGFWPWVSAPSTLPRCHRGAKHPQIASMTPNPKAKAGQDILGTVFICCSEDLAQALRNAGGAHCSPSPLAIRDQQLN